MEPLIKLLLEQCSIPQSHSKHNIWGGCLVQKCLKCSLMKVRILLTLAGFSTESFCYTFVLTFSPSSITHFYVNFYVCIPLFFNVSEQWDFSVCFFQLWD